MNRAEAEARIGRRVRADTRLNGRYVGTLVHVMDGGPWRGMVLIDGVAEPCAVDLSRKPRRGYRVGERITVGAVNIFPDINRRWRGRSYLDALRGALSRLRGRRRPEAWVALHIAHRADEVTSEEPQTSSV